MATPATPVPPATDIWKEACSCDSSLRIYRTGRLLPALKAVVEPDLFFNYSTDAVSLTKFVSLISSPDNYRIELFGGAGTGKTTLMEKLIFDCASGNINLKPVYIDVHFCLRKIKEERQKLRMELQAIEKFLEAQWEDQKYGKTITKEEALKLVLSNPEELIKALRRHMKLVKLVEFEPSLNQVVLYHLRQYQPTAMADVERLFALNPQLLFLFDNVDDALREGDPTDVDWLRSYLTDVIRGQRGFQGDRPMSGIRVLYATRDSITLNEGVAIRIKGVLPGQVMNLVGNYFVQSEYELENPQVAEKLRQAEGQVKTLISSNQLLLDLCRNPFMAFQVCSLVYYELFTPTQDSMVELAGHLFERYICRNLDGYKDNRVGAPVNLRVDPSQLDTQDIERLTTDQVCDLFQKALGVEDSELQGIRKEGVDGFCLVMFRDDEFETIGLKPSSTVVVLDWIKKIKARPLRERSVGELYCQMMTILSEEKFDKKRVSERRSYLRADQDLIMKSGLLASYSPVELSQTPYLKKGWIHPFFESFTAQQIKQ